MAKRLLLILLVSLFIWRIGEAKIIEGIAAKVNDEIVTLTELEAAKRALSSSMGVPVDRMDKEATKKILDHLVELKLILQEARKKGIKVSGQEIEKVLDKIRSGFKTEKEFKEALVSQGYTIEDLRKDYEEELLRQKLIDQEVRSKIQITPKEMEEIRGRFLIQLHARHILVKTKGEAEEILQGLKGGAGFEDLAKERSICPSKEKGGDLGFFVQGEMVKEFDEAAFALKDGKISDIVKTQFGYHIIQAIERRSTPKEELSRLEKTAGYLLWEERFKERLAEWIKGLRKKAYIKVMF